MASSPGISEWRKLPLSLTELCIETTLRCGQAFRWRKIDDEWHCALQGRIVSLKQDATHLHYKATWPSVAAPARPSNPLPSIKTDSSSSGLYQGDPLVRGDELREDDTLQLLHSYFNLDHSLAALYSAWSSCDPNFARRSASFGGIRILNQDPWEAVVGFICSSNNNIARISGMLSRLCARFGTPLGRVGDEDFHDLPDPDALAAAGAEAEAALRALGFGYRARYVADSARLVARDRPPGWLAGLRNPSSPGLGGKAAAEAGGVESGGEGDNASPADPTGYRAAHEALLELPGVGPKVADCVCLMGLGWAEAVPVDTHVWQIAKRDYKFGGGGSGAKTLNKATYDAVGDHFRGIWGPYAGWAQSVLFTANLKSFAEQAAGSGKPSVKVKVEEKRAVKVENGDEGEGILASAATKRTKRKAVAKAVPLKEEVEKVTTDVRVTRTRAQTLTQTRSSKRLKASA